PAADGTVPRHRFGNAEAARDRDHRRTDHGDAARARGASGAVPRARQARVARTGRRVRAAASRRARARTCGIALDRDAFVTPLRRGPIGLGGTLLLAACAVHVPHVMQFDRPSQFVGQWIDLRHTSPGDTALWVLRDNGYDGSEHIAITVAGG